jgi:hypothetical protein
VSGARQLRQTPQPVGLGVGQPRVRGQQLMGAGEMRSRLGRPVQGERFLLDRLRIFSRKTAAEVTSTENS